MQLRTGLYFSARGTGSVVWERLMAGADIESLGEAFAGATGASAAEVRAAIEAFIADAQRQQLGTVDPANGQPVERDGLPSTWTAPVLEAFSDMQDLLLLDPIHDVADEVGWPQQRAV